MSSNGEWKCVDQCTLVTSNTHHYSLRKSIEAAEKKERSNFITILMKCIIRERTQWTLRSILPPFFLLSPGNILEMELERLILYTALQAKRKWNENVNEDIGGVFFLTCHSALRLLPQPFGILLICYCRPRINSLRETIMPVYRHARTRTHNHIHCQIICVQWILLHIPKNVCKKCVEMCGLINSWSFKCSISRRK